MTSLKEGKGVNCLMNALNIIQEHTLPPQVIGDLGNTPGCFAINSIEERMEETDQHPRTLADF